VSWHVTESRPGGEHHDVGQPKRALHRFETLAEWVRDHDRAVESDEGEPSDAA